MRLTNNNGDNDNDNNNHKDNDDNSNNNDGDYDNDGGGGGDVGGGGGVVLNLGKLVHYMKKLLLHIYLKIWTFKFCIMVIADLLLQK